MHEELIEFFRYAPHRPGGSKYKVNYRSCSVCTSEDEKAPFYIIHVYASMLTSTWQTVITMLHFFVDILY